MRTKHLIIALLVIVAIFVGKGMYVTDEVRETTDKSYQQFEMFQNVIHPLIDGYSINVVDETVKVAHGISDIKKLDKSLEESQSRQKFLLDSYIIQVQGTETMDDKELYMRFKEVNSLIEKLQVHAKANDLAALNRIIDSGELYAVFDPMQKCLHNIAGNRLQIAEAYRLQVEKSLKNFEKVMLLACVLIAILAVLAVRYKETTPCASSKRKKHKKISTKKTAK